MRYGQLPEDCGLINVDLTEMMFWLYCPIKVKHDEDVIMPRNLGVCLPFVREVLEREKTVNKYVYLTAKVMHVGGRNVGNRPGWHADGFGTSDINYVWSDCNPTIFWQAEEQVTLSTDHDRSMREMEHITREQGRHVTYPDKHLLKMDSSVIHKPQDDVEPGVRAFVKISISNKQYLQVGNSRNYELEYPSNSVYRTPNRNCPAARS